MWQYGVRDAREDRDLSRAAAERYLLLQALSEARSSAAGEHHQPGRPRLFGRIIGLVRREYLAPRRAAA